MTNPDPKPCPICQKPAVPPHLPFCSDRCRKVDLHRWLGEAYRIEQNAEIAEQAENDEDDV